MIDDSPVSDNIRRFCHPFDTSHPQKFKVEIITVSKSGYYDLLPVYLLFSSEFEDIQDEIQAG